MTSAYSRTQNPLRRKIGIVQRSKARQEIKKVFPETRMITLSIVKMFFKQKVFRYDLLCLHLIFDKWNGYFSVKIINAFLNIIVELNAN